MGYWCHSADERLGNPTQGIHDPLLVKDKVGRCPDELGMNKSMKCDTFPSMV